MLQDRIKGNEKYSKKNIPIPRQKNMPGSNKQTHIDIAERYFDCLAERFPVMCASDEFHFLPRAENAREHYGNPG